jgi:anti-sigma factor (TIGR02949 family)
LLTCKQFLHELNDYLEETLDPATRETLQKHVDECPNCWVVCDTTAKTVKVFKGLEAQAVPKDIQSRLMAAIAKKMAEEGPCCKKHPPKS